MLLYLLFGGLFLAVCIAYIGYMIYGYYTYRLYPDTDDFLPFLTTDAWVRDDELKRDMEECGMGWIHWIDFEETIRTLVAQQLVYCRVRYPTIKEEAGLDRGDLITELKLTEKGECAFRGIVDARRLVHRE